jgi:hypothetical protein
MPPTPSSTAEPSIAYLSHERIKRRPILGGVINEYAHAA